MSTLYGVLDDVLGRIMALIYVTLTLSDVRHFRVVALLSRHEGHNILSS